MSYELGKWYPWNGESCPFSSDTKIRYLLRDDIYDMAGAK